MIIFKDNKRVITTQVLSISLMLCFLLSSIFIPSELIGNNLRLSNIEMTNKDNLAKTTDIEFDVYWENSWRVNGGTKNWDAIWVFAKYRRCFSGSSFGSWGHCILSPNAGDHVPPAGFEIVPAPDSVGVFLQRSTEGSGTVNISDIQLQWNYGSNGITEEFEVEVKLFAIEMVYIPQDSFYVGSGGSTPNTACELYAYPTQTQPFKITSEDAIGYGSTSGAVTHNNSGCDYGGGDFSGPIPAAFPKGFDPFYIAKYELTQGQYVDFLNNLENSVQASARSITSGARNTISGSWPAYQVTTPNRACNYMDWRDALAYLDWAGLRPITELEWEKAARGPTYPNPHEFAWGTELIGDLSGTSVYQILFDGTDSSITDTLYNPGGNMNYGPSSNSATYDGVWRVGIFATPTTTRIQAGASFYGVMEMSGNVYEWVVSIGETYSRAFTGTHGDGMLNVGDASHTNADWQVGSYASLKGGSWVNSDPEHCTISNKKYSRYSIGGNYFTGLRVGRSAPKRIN